ncbi:hypothetical protein [Rhodococcus artemisiae]|uniref:Prolyl oligopeptidase family protein n=1 Tax=Rhodococcus artemisiae TaxID=714159 RepID=A0ABU7LBU6_9NOCA|nr:hypothetical protein [Rhodococcus artemisiae]MEE2058990.1 hypothetical protein [Rhodococcus artemisiae]
MAWPDETSVATGTTSGGVAWRSARVYPNGTSDRATVCAPVALEDGADVKLVIATHGTNGSDATMDSGNGKTVRDALLDAGYVVVAGQLGENTWGNAEAMTHMANLYEWCADLWNVTDTMFFGQSQGGGVVMVATRRKIIPTLRAVAAVAPALNFQWVSDSGSSSADIRAAYGANASTFAAQSADYAPFVGTMNDYATMHFKFWASPDDTTTPKTEHADQFKARGLDYRSASTQVMTVTGTHLSPDHYRPNEVVDFYAHALAVGNVEQEHPVAASGARVRQGGAWVDAAVKVRQGGAWVDAALQVRQGGEWAPTSN